MDCDDIDTWMSMHMQVNKYIKLLSRCVLLFFAYKWE